MSCYGENGLKVYCDNGLSPYDCPCEPFAIALTPQSKRRIARVTCGDEGSYSNSDGTLSYFVSVFPNKTIDTNNYYDNYSEYYEYASLERFSQAYEFERSGCYSTASREVRYLYAINISHNSGSAKTIKTTVKKYILYNNPSTAITLATYTDLIVPGETKTYNDVAVFEPIDAPAIVHWTINTYRGMYIIETEVV